MSVVTMDYVDKSGRSIYHEASITTTLDYGAERGEKTSNSL